MSLSCWSRRPMKILASLTTLLTQNSLPSKDCRFFLVIVLFLDHCPISDFISANLSGGTLISMVELSNMTPKYTISCDGASAFLLDSTKPRSSIKTFNKLNDTVALSRSVSQPPRSSL